MQISIFIGSRLPPDSDEVALKKITHEGKPYWGTIVSKDSLSVREILAIAKANDQRSDHITLIPLLLFG